MVYNVGNNQIGSKETLYPEKETKMTITRTVVAQNGNRKEQELNELASIIIDFCTRSSYPINVVKISDYAEGYNDALNAIASLINGLPGNIVAK